MSKDTKMIWGPDLDKQSEYQQQIVDMGLATQAQLDELNLKSKEWKVEKVTAIKQEQNAVLEALAAALSQHAKPTDPDVQHLIRRHFKTMQEFWNPTKEGYIKLADFYCKSPDFQQFISTYHPKLTLFLAQAMKAFAERELS